MKSFSKQNFKLIIHSKPDRNQLKLTVCIVLTRKRVTGTDIARYDWNSYRAGKDFFSIFITSVTGQKN